MSHHPSARSGRTALVLLVGVLSLVAAVACSSDEVAMPEDLVIGTLPSAVDRSNCADPVGDISRAVSAEAGSLTEPTGVDLIAARADVGDADMTVTFTANGPIDEVVEPIFSMIQGVSGQEVSFELRALQVSDGGWALTLITWQDEDGGVRESDPLVLGVPVTVDGDELTYTVPLRELPKLVTIVWQFGASGIAPPAGGSNARERVFDDCNNFGTQTGPGTSVEAEPPPPPANDASSPLGTQLTSDDEIKVTVFAFQKPAVDPEPLTVQPEAGYEAAVLEAEVCAGGTDVTIGTGNFWALTSKNELWKPWDPPQAAALPAFPDRGVLTAGSCTRGWITFELPTESQIGNVVFAPESGGSETGTLLWTVA